MTTRTRPERERRRRCRNRALRRGRSGEERSLRLGLPTLHVIEAAPHAALGALIVSRAGAGPESGGSAARDRVVLVGRSEDVVVPRAFGIEVDAIVTPTLGVASSAARRPASWLRSWNERGWMCERVMPWSAGAFEACIRVDDLVKGNPALVRVSEGRELGAKFARAVPRRMPVPRAGESPIRTVAIFADPATGCELTPYMQVLAVADKAGVSLRVLIPRGCVDQARALRLWSACGMSLECELCDEPLWYRGFDVGLSILPASEIDSTASWAASFWAGACDEGGAAGSFVMSEQSSSSARATASRLLVEAVLERGGSHGG